VALAAVWAAALACAVQAQEPAPRTYLSIDYTSHPTFRAAVRNSFAPVDYRANVGASLRNSVEVLNPARYVGAVVLVEMQRQLASGQGLSLSRVLGKLDPAGLVGGYLGSNLGEILGATAQTAMARAMGPIGGTVGFTLRPILWLFGSTVGNEIGKSLAHSRSGNPFGQGVAVALREYNPIQDSLQMIGDNVGGVIAQALIPVPFVGLVAGSAIGGMTGLLASKLVLATGVGRAIDDRLRGIMRAKADRIDAGSSRRDGETGRVPLIAPGLAPSGAGEILTAPLPGARPEVRRAYEELLQAVQNGSAEDVRRAVDAYRQARAKRAPVGPVPSPSPAGIR
jgi:hypothetical protein